MSKKPEWVKIKINLKAKKFAVLDAAKNVMIQLTDQQLW